MVKNLSMQETQEMWVQSLGQEDPLEEEMATHSSILVWEIPWTEEPGGLQSMAPLTGRACVRACARGLGAGLRGVEVSAPSHPRYSDYVDDHTLITWLIIH